LKWPNDVYLQQRKVCGILIEAPHGRSPRLVVGVGINVNNSFASAPPEQRQIAISMSEVAGGRLSRARILIRVLRNLEDQLALLNRNIPQVVDDCRQYCLLSGQRVTCQIGSRQVRAVCDGIDEDGALRLVTPSGVERIVSGQVELV
jgi:BirA family biotin operon repressor/biotin-[acetyl-CoA-carboxylase] ligase